MRYRLDALDISVEELIRRSGVSRSTVFRLLGERPPSIVNTEILLKLAAALEVDPTQLAALWHGTVSTVNIEATAEDDEREKLVRGFVLATSDLSYDDLLAVLEVARMAAQMSKRPTEE
jgi:transcriptional regulator with XRE-family HTH domain